MGQTPTTLRLRCRRLAPCRATVNIHDGDLVLRLPKQFGRHRWTVPVTEVGVLAVTTHTLPVDRDAVAFPGGLLVPFLPSGGPHTMPTTALLFKHPRRVPPLRAVAALSRDTRLPIGYLRSRSVAGCDLDGALLRFAEPALAIDALTRAGVEPVDDCTSWLARHHPTTHDPAEMAAALHRDRTTGRLDAAAAYAPLAGVVAVGLLEQAPPGAGIGAAVLSILAGLALRSVALTRVQGPRRPVDMAGYGGRPIR